MTQIDVIVPCKNSILTIQRCIDSICQQGVLVGKIIIVDSMSDDGTSEYIEKLKTVVPNIIYIREADRSMTEALNKGFRHITNNLWSTINADDEYCEAAFQNVVNAYSTNNTCRVFMGKTKVIDDAIKREKYETVPWLLNRKWSWKVMGCYTPESSVFFNISTLKEVGKYNEKIKYTQDFEYYLRIFENGKGKFINQTLSLFHIHNNQISKIRNKEMKSEVLEYMGNSTIRKLIGGTYLGVAIQVAVGVRRY